MRNGTNYSALGQKSARRDDVLASSVSRAFDATDSKWIEVELRENCGPGLWVSQFVSKLEKGLARYP